MDAITENKTVHNAGADEANDNEPYKPDPELPDLDAQRGVQDVEAITLSWSRNALIAVFLKYVII